MQSGERDGGDFGDGGFGGRRQMKMGGGRKRKGGMMGMLGF